MYLTICIIILLSMLYWCCFTRAQNVPPVTYKSEPKGESTDLRGNTRILLCSANGYPAPVYRWLKNDQYITNTNITDTSLKLQSLQPSDSGAYQCVASNGLGSLLSSKAIVNVAYMLPFGNRGSGSEIKVEEGKACIIDMPYIESYPAPTVQWFEINDFSPYPVTREAAKYQVTLNNQLVILDTSQNSDNGKIYRASATNGYQLSSDTLPFLIRVVPSTPTSSPGSLMIVIKPSNVTVIQDSDTAAMLECVANARPLNYVSILWYKLEEGIGAHRTSIEQDNIKYFLSTYRRVLTINNPTESDSGVYQCEAKYTPPNGVALTVDASTTLSVYVKPNFLVVPPLEVQRDIKTSFSLHCQAVGVPMPVVQWYRNTVKISNNERFIMSGNGSLTIFNSDISDSGIFQCFVRNDAGEVYYATWVRVVSFKPEIIEVPQNQSAVAGEGARFVCHSNGAPKPIVQWFKLSKNNQSSNIELQAYEGRVRIESEDLVFQSTEKTDDGMYMCNVSNTLGFVIARAYLSITVRTRIILPPQNASIVKGTTAVLQCGVDKDDSVIVTYKWLFLSSSLGSNSSTVVLPSNIRQSILSSGGLQITSVRNSDIGTYTCVITSSSGNGTSMASVTVVELPYAPSIQLVSLIDGTPTSVEVSWLAGFDGNSPILNYIIQTRMMMQNSSNQPDLWQTALANVPSNKVKAVIADLLPSKSYQFRVSAVNAIGEGESSVPSGVIQIPDQPPSGPPKGIVGSPRSNRSIILMWEPPDVLKWNGDILGYIIQFRLSRYPDSTAHSENISSIASDSFSFTYEIGGLIVFQEYEISLAAYNRKGVGVFSDPVYARTMEGKPSTSPRGVSVKASSSTSVNITWLPPDSQYINGINQGYHVTVYTSDLGNIKPTVITVPSHISNVLDAQSTVVTGLLKYTQYSIVITCFTLQGEGPGTVRADVKTLEDIPDAVSSLGFDSVMDTSLVVVWLPPKQMNGILLGYNITYGESKGSKMSTIRVEANITNCTITRLTATTVYTVTVAAFTRVGQGPSMSADIKSGVTPDVLILMPETIEVPQNQSAITGKGARFVLPSIMLLIMIIIEMFLLYPVHLLCN